MSLTSIIERRRARRRYFATAKSGYGLTRRLHTTADPAERAQLLEHLAAIDEALAGQHTAAWGPDPLEHEGGRDMAISLVSSAELLRHLAFTERAIATRLTPGVVWEDLHERCGLSTSVNEIMLWAELAITADRRTRAELIDQIWEYAAVRVGGQAAEALASIGTTERELAAGGAAEWADQSRVRRAIAAFFALFGAVLMLPMVPGFAGLPIWARASIALTAAGLLIQIGMYGLGARRLWSTAWTCKSTGERLLTAAHHRAHTSRCYPTSWRILPRWRNS